MVAKSASDKIITCNASSKFPVMDARHTPTERNNRMYTRTTGSLCREVESSRDCRTRPHLRDAVRQGEAIIEVCIAGARDDPGVPEERRENLCHTTKLPQPLIGVTP